MARLPALAWIGNAAVVLFGNWGSVTEQAKKAGCSRQTVYTHAELVQEAVEEVQAGGPSRAELQHENQKLREENSILWEWLDGCVEFGEDKQQRFAATAAGMGLSLLQILALLRILLPKKCCPSRAKLGRWVQSAGKSAGQLLATLDKLCQQIVVVLALDEIFVRRQPILVAVEPHSMAWLVGVKSDKRDGPAWLKVLQPWHKLKRVLSDAGSGLQAAIKALQEKVVDLEAGLDVFHTKYEASRLLRVKWSKVESLWVKAEECDREVKDCLRRGVDARGATARARAAWNKAIAAFEQLAAEEEAWKQAASALELFRGDGQLNDAAWASEQLRQALSRLPGKEWAKVRRLLQEPRSLTFLKQMQRDLAEVEPNEELREALAKLWWLRRRRRQDELAQKRALVQMVICVKLAENWQEAYARVARVLYRTVRASSVVECMNSVIRMHQARHRTLTQPLLDLKRLSWNCRSFVEGKRRGRCPYEHLGLKLPTYDFWELLQMDPSHLEQAVSSLQLAL
jgi:hypothetical protein